MRSGIVEIILTLISGGGLALLAKGAATSWAAARRARRDRETAVQRAQRQAAEWELVARRTRVLAVAAGVDPIRLPTGPGEDPAWKEHDNE